METTTTKSTLFSKFDGNGQAFATGRCLPEHLKDGEEWQERGTIDGVSASLVFYFDADEIAGAEGDAENYPWDLSHVVRILDEDEDDLIPRQIG
jgi:hypothetical protein